MFEKCVCGKQVIESISLLGGYKVYLCSDCRNEWGEYIMAQPLVEEFYLNLRLIQRAVSTQANDLEALNKREIGLHTKLYYLAKKWVEERKAKYAKSSQ